MNTTRAEPGKKLKGILVVGLTAVRVAVAAREDVAVANPGAKVEVVIAIVGAGAGVVVAVAVEDGETVAIAETAIEGIDIDVDMAIPSIVDKEIATMMMIMIVEGTRGIAAGLRMIGGAGLTDNRWKMKLLSLIVQ